jgi:O-antigen/teichoic acid export membrane protein
LNDAHPPVESVRSRYAVTLGAQVVRMLLSVVTAAVVPRTLGPAAYGGYSFILSTSTAIRGFLDNGAQQAFFTFSSQTRSSGPLTKLYGLVLGGQLALVLLLIGLAVASGTTDWLWRGQRIDQIVLVTLVDWALFIVLVLQQLGDSKGRTVFPQIAAAVVSALTLLVLLVLSLLHALNFYSYAWLNLLGAALTCIALCYGLFTRHGAQLWHGSGQWRGYLRRWWLFTRPLIVLQYYFPVVAYLGIYLLQRWYGSSELGFYALALQWSGFALVFTTSGLNIFWREIAHSAAYDLAESAVTYQRFSRMFLFLSLALSCGLSAGSRLLVQTVAGARFAAAVPVLAIMAFYPISQTINQLTVASMKATERTASYARWSFLLSLPELVLTYVLLAPGDAVLPGLHLGATGMAIKTSLWGLVAAQVYDFVNCRFFKLSFSRALLQKAAAALMVGAAAIVTLMFGGVWLQRAGLSGLTALCVASLGYAASLIALLALWPSISGVSREQLVRTLRWASWPFPFNSRLPR